MTTANSESSVSVFARTAYSEYENGHYAWHYTIEFENRGSTHIQLMTRHMIFVDADGLPEEIRGPGGKGQMPVLAPGTAWSYTSGIRLKTSKGSMHGGYVFEEVATDSQGLQRRAGRRFGVRLGRLAMYSDGGGNTVLPCAAIDARMISPSIVVAAPERIYIGAQLELAKADEDLSLYTWKVEMQINNVRPHPVTIVALSWRVVTSNGKLIQTRSEGIDGAEGKKTTLVLKAGGIARLTTTLAQIGTSKATMTGAVLVKLGTSSDEDEAYDGEKENSEEDEDGHVMLTIGPLGASTDGLRVPLYEPLGFLQQEV